jgi:hypothetical protein
MTTNRDEMPPLPERVRLISLWGRWAAAVAAGVKPLETRSWRWPYAPGWVGICAARRYDGKIDGQIIDPFPEVARVEPGAIVALAFVTGSRLLLPADLPRSLVYGPRLWAWELAIVRRIAPVPMARCPQKFASVGRAVIERAIANAA